MGVSPPSLLQAHKAALLKLTGRTTQQALRWHLSQMLPRLELTPTQTAAAVAILFTYLEDKSRIVKTFAMQVLADFAERDPALRRRVLPLLNELAQTGSSAMRSRARKLIPRLGTR